MNIASDNKKTLGLVFQCFCTVGLIGLGCTVYDKVAIQASTDSDTNSDSDSNNDPIEDAGVDESCDLGDNVAIGATAASSGGGDSTDGYGPERMNDGDFFMPHWVTAENFPEGAWISVTWMELQTIGGIFIDTEETATEEDFGRTLSGGTIQWWDGTAWVTAGSVSGRLDDWSYTFSPPVVTTELRIFDIVASDMGTQQVNPQIYEWEVYTCN